MTTEAKAIPLTVEATAALERLQETVRSLDEDEATLTDEMAEQLVGDEVAVLECVYAELLDAGVANVAIMIEACDMFAATEDDELAAWREIIDFAKSRIALLRSENPTAAEHPSRRLMH